MPFVTIGVCVRNNEETVRRALESIFQLEYQKNLLEIIVVDGLSNDKTLTVTEKLLEQSNLRWRTMSDQGKGLGHARQLIVDHACGQFIAFVDGDQHLQQAFLRTIVEDLLNHPNVAAIRGVQGLTIGLPIPASIENYVKFIEGASCIRQTEPWSFGIGGSVVKKRVIVQVGGFDSSFMQAGEDTDLAARLVEAGWKILNSKSSVFYHRSRQRWTDLCKEYRGWEKGFAGALGELGVFGFLTHALAHSLCSSVLSVKYVVRAFRITRDLACTMIPFLIVFERAVFLEGYLACAKTKEDVTRFTRKRAANLALTDAKHKVAERALIRKVCKTPWSIFRLLFVLFIKKEKVRE